MSDSLTVPHELNRADRRILAELEGGRANPSYLADELDYTRQYTHQRLQLLVAAQLVKNLGHGLYAIDVDDTQPETDGGFIGAALTCPDCGQQFQSFTELRDHMDDTEYPH